MGVHLDKMKFKKTKTHCINKFSLNLKEKNESATSPPTDHPVAGRGPGSPEQTADAPPPTDRCRPGEQGHRPLTPGLVEERRGAELATTKTREVVFLLKDSEEDESSQTLLKRLMALWTKVGGASGITGCWAGLKGLLHMHGATKTEEPMSTTDRRMAAVMWPQRCGNQRVIFLTLARRS